MDNSGFRVSISPERVCGRGGLTPMLHLPNAISVDGRSLDHYLLLVEGRTGIKVGAGARSVLTLAELADWLAI